MTLIRGFVDITMKLINWFDLRKNRYGTKPNVMMLQDSCYYYTGLIKPTGKYTEDRELVAIRYDRDYVIQKLKRDLSELSDLSQLEFLELMNNVYCELKKDD